MNRLEDVELLQRARGGDESAFAQLFVRHEGAIYRYAVYMCGRDTADDIVQETFLAVLQQRTRNDPPEGAVRSYLIGIARHRILKRAARETWDTEEIHGEIEQRVDLRQPSPLEDVVRAESIERVRAAVESLPPAFREAVVLCELHEMDYVAAAVLAKCPVGTIRSRLHRGRALLAAILRGVKHGS